MMYKLSPKLPPNYNNHNFKFLDGHSYYICKCEKCGIMVSYNQDRVSKNNNHWFEYRLPDRINREWEKSISCEEEMIKSIIK